MPQDFENQEGIPDYDFPILTKKEIESKLAEFVFKDNANYEAFFERFAIPLDDMTNTTGKLKFKSIKLDDSAKDLIKNKKFPSLFKNHFIDDFSLTPFGFATIIATGLYPRVYSGKIKIKDLHIPNTLILFKNFFKSPFFVERSNIYYFDGANHVEIKLYGSLEAFVEIRRKSLC